MTKVIIIGEQDINNLRPKKIEFKKFFSEYLETILIPDKSPNNWDNIELIKKSKHKDLDLMLCYNDNRNNSVLYFGNFNDGIV